MPSRAAALAFAIFVSLAAVGLFSAQRAHLRERAEERRSMDDAARAAALAVEDQLGGTLAAAHALAALVRQSGRVEDFPAVAAEMLRVYDGASALQLAPGGVISEVYPLLGNEAAVVRNHGGAIAFESRPGGGTCFTLHLPAHDGTPLAPAARLPSAAPCNGSVLVVDDEKIVRETAMRMLERMGYACAGAGGTDEAVRLLEDGLRVDVALVDLMMPGRDGVECLAELRRVRPGLVAVLSSGFADDRRVQRALESGFAAFLYKPYGFGELSAALREVLERSRAS